jgi:hypothetical protein
MRRGHRGELRWGQAGRSGLAAWGAGREDRGGGLKQARNKLGTGLQLPCNHGGTRVVVRWHGRVSLAAQLPGLPVQDSTADRDFMLTPPIE